ncbi:unnamed protein product [Candida verbasci]|uniref:2'-phosphotransferase n=1 Tax=Candida verbasci TaxID=1227364 RepID=A0A9W4XAI9_9ASCO|nr:unnamed protein product [Candida verbasci]
MMSNSTAKRDISISKSLSYLLRHGAEKENLSIDESGYVKISQLLNHQRLKSFKTTFDDISRIVKINDKQRFQIKDDLICATQGHSMKNINNENLQLLTKEELINLHVYHGTTTSKLSIIKSSGGLSRMNRNHIHLTCKEYCTVSGIKKQSNVLIFIDINKCLNQGIKFYKSLNNVILTEGDEQGYIKWDNIEKIIQLNNTHNKDNLQGIELNKDEI